MTSLDHDDAIEVISTSNAETTPVVETGYICIHSISQNSKRAALLPEDRVRVLPEEKPRRKPVPAQPPPSKKQKRIKNAVMVVGTILILMCLLLVAVTLALSDHIDEMGVPGETGAAPSPVAVEIPEGDGPPPGPADQGTSSSPHTTEAQSTDSSRPPQVRKMNGGQSTTVAPPTPSHNDSAGIG